MSELKTPHSFALGGARPRALLGPERGGARGEERREPVPRACGLQSRGPAPAARGAQGKVPSRGARRLLGVRLGRPHLRVLVLLALF